MTKLQPLRSYIRQNVARLRSSPCLLISSAPPPATVSTAVAGTKAPASISSDQQEQQAQKEQLKSQQQQNHPKVDAFVERNIQSLTMEFNLRTVPCHISSAFPTTNSVNKAVSLAKRAGLKEGSFGSGDGTVIGIGSGAAIDLAKAVADSLFGNITSHKDDDRDENGFGRGGSLVLAPCTLGGLWAASSNLAPVLLDTKEEMLLPHLTSSWSDAIVHDNVSCRRTGTVVTLDLSRHLAMPPLYTPFQPLKRSEFLSSPSMAHVAAAALAIVLDVARSVDLGTKAGINNRHVDIQKHVTNEMGSVASACASVLELAALAAKDGVENSNGNTELAQQHHLLDAVPRLSQLVEQSSLLTQTPITIAGTIPQKLANALLPTYFPQCHIITYLACILPGLCDVLSTSASSDGGVSMVETVARSIIDSGNGNQPVQLSSLSPWASHVTMESGIPSMAGLAYGTPDINTMMGSLDSYETLVASINGSSAIFSGQDDHRITEYVLQRSLNR